MSACVSAVATSGPTTPVINVVTRSCSSSYSTHTSSGKTPMYKSMTTPCWSRLRNHSTNNLPKLPVERMKMLSYL